MSRRAPYVPYVSRTCPVRVPYVSRTCPIRQETLRAVRRGCAGWKSKTWQEESDSEGPAVKKYRTMLTTDRGAFDKEATRFLRNLRGQGKPEGGGVA